MVVCWLVFVLNTHLGTYEMYPYDYSLSIFHSHPNSHTYLSNNPLQRILVIYNGTFHTILLCLKYIAFFLFEILRYFIFELIIHFVSSPLYIDIYMFSFIYSLFDFCNFLKLIYRYHHPYKLSRVLKILNIGLLA